MMLSFLRKLFAFVVATVGLFTNAGALIWLNPEGVNVASETIKRLNLL
jgi:hypothetical protein